MPERKNTEIVEMLFILITFLLFIIENSVSVTDVAFLFTSDKPSPSAESSQSGFFLAIWCFYWMEVCSFRKSVDSTGADRRGAFTGGRWEQTGVRNSSGGQSVWAQRWGGSGGQVLLQDSKNWNFYMDSKHGHQIVVKLFVLNNRRGWCMRQSRSAVTRKLKKIESSVGGFKKIHISNIALLK